MEEGILQLTIMAWGWPVPLLTGLLALLMAFVPATRSFARWIAWVCIAASVLLLLAFVSVHLSSRAPAKDAENDLWYSLMMGGPLVVSIAILLALRNHRKSPKGNEPQS